MRLKRTPRFFSFADIIFLMLLSFTLTTCQKDHMLDCFKSAGEYATVTREAADFVNINLTDNVDLVIHPGTSPYIKVTAGENLIDGIITELSGNTLYIRNENRCNWMRSFENTFTVEVGMQQVNNIYYDGSGNISCIDTIRNNDFVFDSFGGSGTIEFLFNVSSMRMNNHIGRTDMHAIGYAAESNIFINDVATADASALVADVCNIRNSSTGDCRVKVSNQLNVQILYMGNVFYSGNPSISQEITGGGALIHF